MTDAIRISLIPDTLHAQPDGSPIEAVITVQNIGEGVDQFAVELDGLPNTWYKLTSTSVALFPQDKDEAHLIIQPPRGGRVKAGAYPFTVTALSRADPSQASRTEGTLTIGAITQFDADISPRRASGRQGQFTLTLRNGGNADLDVPLEAVGEEGGYRYTFQPPLPHVEAGQRKDVELVVEPAAPWWRRLVGPKRQHDFEVTVQPLGDDPKTLPAQFVYTPRFRTWQPIRRLAFLLALIVLLLVIFFVPAVNGALGQSMTTVRQNICARVSLWCPPAPPPPTIPFYGAFKDFHDQHPNLVGNALEQERISTAARFTTQRTTTGLLVYDRKDGHVFLIPGAKQIYEYDPSGEHVLPQAP